MAYTYDYPRPAVTADVLLFAPAAGALTVLVIQRGGEPFAGRWAFPGGFVNENEDLEAAARRELEEETGLPLPRPLLPLGAYGAPGRDPRGHTVSAAFFAVLDAPVPVQGSDDAREARFVPVSAVAGALAFDHDRMLADARARARLLLAADPSALLGAGVSPEETARFAALFG